MGVVVEQPSQQGDVSSERVFSHRRIAPTCIHQFVFGDQTARVAKQAKQYTEGLGLDGQGLSVALQLKLPLIDLYIRESENSHRFFTHIRKSLVSVHSGLTLLLLPLESKGVNIVCSRIA